VEGDFGKRIRPVVSADFDGDGTADVVRVEEYDDKVAVLRGTASGELAPPQKFLTGRQPTMAIPADCDEDGKPDLVVLHRRSRQVAVLRNTTKDYGAKQATAPPAPERPVLDPWATVEPW